MRGLSPEQTILTESLAVAAPDASLTGIRFQGYVTVDTQSVGQVVVRDSDFDGSSLTWFASQYKSDSLVVVRTSFTCNTRADDGLAAYNLGFSSGTEDALYIASSSFNNCADGVYARTNGTGSVDIDIHHSLFYGNDVGFLLDNSEARAYAYYSNNISAFNGAGISIDDFTRLYGSNNNLWENEAGNYVQDAVTSSDSDIYLDPQLNFDDYIIPAPDPVTSPLLYAGDPTYVEGLVDFWGKPFVTPPTVGPLEPID